MNGMPDKVSDDCLAVVLGNAREPGRPMPGGWIDRNAARIVGQPDPVPSYRIGDWMDMAGIHGMCRNLDALASLVGATVVTCYGRPGSKARMASGGDGLLPAVFCAALLRLEDLGFVCGAAAAAAAHRPLLLKRAEITQHELRVLWATKEAGKMAPFSLVGSSPPEGWPVEGEILDMPSGGKLYAGCDQNGAPTMVVPGGGRRLKIETECYRRGLSHLLARDAPRLPKDSARHAH